MLLCILGMLPLVSHTQVNIVKNPSFEIGTSYFPNALYNNQVTNWAKGYSSPSGHVAPYNYGGTPDYYYYSGTSGCGFGTPPNMRVDPSYYPTYPVTGQKFVFLGGDENSYGESVIGEFDVPLCEGAYTVSLWARASNSMITSGSTGCTSWNHFTTFAGNKIEVVLRKSNNYALEKILYTTPTLDYTQWVHYTQLVTITAADIAAGYNRIEFRHAYMGPTAVPANESEHAFIDEVGLIIPVPTSTINLSLNCGDSIDLDTTLSACNDSTLWILVNQTVVNPTIVSPGTNTTYIKRCYTAAGCLESVDTVNIEVKTGTYNNTTRNIACGDSIDLDTLSGTSCDSTVWHLVGQGIISSTVVSPGTTQQYVKLCYSAGGCIQAIDTITININPPSTNSLNYTLLCTDTIDLDTIGTYYTPCANVEWELQGVGLLSSTIISPGTSGVYERTCYSANGCVKNITTVNITVATKSLPDINKYMICGEQVALNAPGGYSSYLWAPDGETTQSITADDQGTFTVTMTTADGCDVTQTFVVNRTDLNPIVINFNICQPTVFTPTSCNNTSSVQSWEWTFPGGSPFSLPGSSDGSVTMTNTGTYELTVHYANGCACTYIINVSPVVSIGLTEYVEVCYGSTAVLQAFYAPVDPDYTITWDGVISTDLSKIYIYNTTPFTTEAKLFDENGCLLLTKTFVVTIKNQTPGFGMSVKLCEGESYNFAVLTNTTFIIEPMTGVTNVTSTGATITPPAGGQVYTIYTQDANGNCYASTLDLSYHNPPVSVPEVHILCEGECVELVVNCLDPYTDNVVWQDGFVGNSRLVCPSSSYEYYQYDCYAGTCLLESHDIQVYNYPKNIVDHGIDPTPILLCPDEALSISLKCPGGSGTNSQWYDAFGNTVPVNAGTGLPSNIPTTNNGPLNFTRVVTGPGPCDTCTESYSIAEGQGEGPGGHWRVDVAESILGLSDNFDCEYQPGFPVHQFDKCDPCVTFQMPAQFNTIFQYDVTCHWTRLVRNQPGDGNPGNVHFENTSNAMQGFTFDPVTGNITVCFSQLTLNPLTTGYCQNIVSFCYRCDGTSGCENAEEVCFDFYVEDGPCKKGSEGVIPAVAREVNEPFVDIYPNPSPGVFTLGLSNYDLVNTSYTITDAVGRAIMRADNIASDKTVIDLSKYEKGIYFISVREGEAITTKKIIIQ